MSSLDPAAHRVVTLAGHVDHGKSTLLRALTGMEPDRLPEERLRGRTIELGFLWTHLGDSTRVAFVDVPGHARLIGTMIAGSGVSPAALLVIAADDGPSIQTREHLDILDLLGVPGIVIALTKVDRVDQRRLSQVEAMVLSLIAGTSFAGAPLVPVAPLEGRGIERLKDELRRGLAAISPPAGDRSARLWIDRAFSVDGSGTVVTGTLADGPLRRGDLVSVLPGGARARVRRIQQLGQDVEVAQPGTRAAANLVGIDVRTMRRGDVLIAGETPASSSVIDTWIRLLPDERIGGSEMFRIHCGTATRSCRARVLGVESDGSAVRLTCNEPLPTRVGDRLILRAPGRGRTIGGGIVVDPLVLTRGPAEDTASRTRSVRAAATALRAARSSAAVQAAWLLLEPGIRSAGEIETWTGGRPIGATGPGVLSAPEVAEVAETAETARMARVGSYVTSEEMLSVYLQRLVEAADRDEEVNTAIAGLVDSGLPTEAAKAVLEHARASGRVDVGAGGDVLVAHGSAEKLTSDRVQRHERLIARFVAGALEPPDLLEVADELGVSHLERQSLVASGALVRIGDLTFAGAVVDQACARLGELQRASGPFTASQARVALETTRRIVIPLLEHLRRIGRARFDGQQHHIVDY